MRVWHARAQALRFMTNPSLARGTRSHARVACEGPSPTVMTKVHLVEGEYVETASATPVGYPQCSMPF